MMETLKIAMICYGSFEKTVFINNICNILHFLNFIIKLFSHKMNSNV